MNSIERNPYQLGPMEYKEYLSDLNDSYLRETRQKLLPIENFLIQRDLCAIVVGSDGKKERHPQSKIEVMYVQSEGKGDIITPSVIASTFIETTGKRYSDVFDVEINGSPVSARIGTDVLSYVLGDQNRIYPDRILNSRFVLGDQDIHKKAKRTVLEEMNMDILRRKIRKAMNEQSSRHLKSCITGISRGETCFDEHNQFYDERNKPGKFGFKHAFVRLVQRKLDLRTQELMKEGQMTIEEMSCLPTNTADKLMFFKSYNQDTPAAYLWFLQRYHELQEVYKARRDLSALDFDSYDFRQCSEIILRNWQKQNV